MNTEPPVGDDLQRMLVSMKQHVLERAAPHPKRRARRTGIAIGVVGVLLLGAAGGGVALGLIPTSITGAPEASATATPEAQPSETPSGAPVVDEPTLAPAPTQTPASTRPPYSVTDPSTWTISGDEVGPLALGGDATAETDDLAAAYTADRQCLNPNVVFWTPRDADQPELTTVRSDDGRLQSVQIGTGAPGEGTDGPKTASGIGTGSSLEQIRAAYPDVRYTEPGNDVDAVPSDSPYGGWTTRINGAFVSFRFPPQADGAVADSVWISTTDQDPPTEFCG